MKDLKNLLEDHKAEIITLNADIDSYKSMIQELQDKLTNPVVVIGDNDIDRLIASEQLFIANNENIKNVILSLKTALEKKNEELCTLKNTSNTDSSETLTTIQELQEQLAANAQVIHTLTLEKSQLKSTEQQLSEKLLDLENVKFNVDKINNDSTIQIQLLKEENNNLRADIITLKGKYESEITHMTEKIRNLESDICSKHDVILTYDDKVSLLEVINKHEIEIMQLKETLNDCNKIVDSFTEDLIEYNNSNIHKEIGENLEPNSDLRNKIRNFIDIVKQIQKTLLQSIDCKNVEIDEIKQDLIGKGIELEEKSSLLENNYQVLHIIENKIRNVLSKLNIESQRFEGKDQMEHILLMVESLVDYHKTITSENEDKSTHIETIISEAKAEISALTQENIKLNNDILQFEVDKAGLYKEINTAKDDKVQIIQDLKTSNRILGELQDDLKSKTSEIEILEKKALQWKEQFLNSDTKVKLQLNELESDNNKLREQLERYSAHSLTVSSDNYNQYDINSKGNSEEIPELQSPPSLLTICCNRICEAIQPVESDDLNSVPSDAGVQCNCRCTELSSEIDILLGNKNYLENVVEKVQNDNMNLLKEQEDARREIQLLVDSMFELQKKIVNHRTNLSTLTATTYAENKSLTSQLKFLQHYHSLFYRSCEKDIPEFKKQLQDLLTILKTEYSNKHNDSFRRYSLPSALDNSVLQSLKYESLLDGDLLMLDTNITLTTCDNTVVGNDQTLDLTQISKEVSCQTTSTSDVFETDSALFEMKTASKILQNIESIKMENDKLKEVVEEYELMKVNKSKLVDSANSPLKTPLANIQGDKTCDNCKRLQEILDARNNIIHENELLKQKLSETITIKTDLESQYNNLVLEIPSIDALVDKLKNTEKETVIKSSEILKLTKSLDEKNLELKNLQEENNTLSNQLMENIDEADSLKNEVELLKKRNTEITQKYSELHKSTDLPEKENSNDSENYIKECSECLMKDSIITSLKSKLISEPNQILSRSYSESESSSRYNKICTLQNEIHAGKEDCNELKNEVINIKNHLDRSNVDQAMDLDVSMGDSFKMSFNKECEDVEESVNKSIIHGIPEERPSDIYTLDKIDCVNYCIDKTGLNKEKFTCDMKIIDVMQMLHTNFITKHSNEVENLVNQLKDLQESRNSLQFRVNNLIDSQEKLSKEVEEKNTYLQTMAIVVSNIKNNLLALNTVSDDCDELVFIEYYKDNFCKIVDKELGLESLKVFENIVNIIEEKHKSEIIRLSQNDKLQQSQIQHVTEELQSLSKQLEALKSEIKNKENDYNLLRLQKQRIHEISNAVTLDIIKKEKGLRETISKVYEKLAQQNLIDTQVVNASAPVNDVISDLLNSLLQKQTNSNVQKENSNLLLELTDIKLLLEERNKQICELKDKLSDVNRKHREEVDKKEKELQEQVALHNILRSTYDKKVEENEANINVIAKLTDEINILKGTIIGKELAILALEDKLHNQKQQSPSKNTQLLEALQQYKEEIEKLKSANDIIQKEKELACEQLQQANDLIQQNKVEIERITSDVLILKETVDHSSNDMEDLRLEARRLLEQNTQLKEQMKEKTKELSRLETNIKTYQKSAEISCKMITRLKKEKADVEKSNSELVEKVAELTRVVEELNAEDKLYLDEVNTLKTEKQSLEERIAELETDLNKQRLSLDINAGLRSRRQSLYDSLRTFSESEEDPKKIEAEFKARRCDDNFMDVDDNSNRSTPIKLPKGRDSLASRQDQSEEEGSRASSVQAIRRRRQSIHDAHRSVSALETSRRHSADRNNESSSSDTTGEVSKLRKQLLQCKEELEEWRDKYREVDEECEICAQYLRERDEQCRNLRSDKQNLEALIDELKQQLQVVKHVKNESVEAGVNTDEDWANLHSIVVDRMSYDAEVDKNKKLTKIVEELRFQKQELKVTMTKMQKVLDSNSFRDRELETVKSELANCRKQVAELKERNRELDEECETCAEYLKEREEQCRKLKEAKKSLEIKLLDYQDSSVCLSVRKKRQSLHDQNRVPRTDVVHVATDTGDDLSNTALEEGECCKRTAEIHAEELRRLRLAVERSSQQKAALEQQLVAISAATPLYVSTGSAIVQNQQITDVLRENQKLKSINSKLMKIYKKSKSLSTNRENEDPADDTNT
ncbi:unnamed protein product [Leptosia nina]|uniref:Uncharacterized protein n=1 Tax=Leptosia nina TaxID=320188 RepID=A0AAV1JQ87_9NEOP